MKDFLQHYDQKWFSSIWAAVVIGLLCLIVLKIPHEAAYYLGLGLPVVALGLSALLGLRKFIKGDTRSGILQVVASGIVFAFASVAGFIYTGYLPFDYYADYLKIPEGLEVYEPLPQDYEYDRSGAHDHLEFNMIRSIQPGIYSYELWLGKTEPGEVYLKAYEVTHEDPLSAASVKKYSRIPVENGQDSVIRFNSPSDFNIDEGDWGDPYAARFEVWFKAEGKDQDRKLTEKVFEIEGWQR